MVLWLATRNMLSYRHGVTIENKEVESSTDPNMIYILFPLGLSLVVDQLIQRSDNEDMTNR